MNPTSYQQMMAQQLLGAGMAAPGMAGSQPMSPYGQNFVLGNQMQTNPQTAGMLGSLPSSQQLAQPMATYQGMA